MAKKRQNLKRNVKDSVFKKLFSNIETVLSFLQSEGFNTEELKKYSITKETIEGISQRF